MSKRVRFLVSASLWIFPLFALMIAGWLYYQKYSNRGPLIKIEFTEASGIEVNKTPLQFRGVKVGVVEDLKLASDGESVIAYARLDLAAQELASEGAQFRIIQPEVGFEGIRGLDTLLRGSYIRIEKGKGKPQYEFKGLSGSGPQDSVEPRVSYFLRSPHIDSINSGDGVSFRGLQVGVVSSVELTDDGKWVDIRIDVERDYVRLIRTNTVFWTKTGVDADLSLFGAEIEIASLESLMRGGIAFATPSEAGGIANAESRFDLQAKAPEKWKDWSPELKF